jgi:MFS family permease
MGPGRARAVTVRNMVPELPRRVWLLLAGECLAAVGSGLTLPFLFVYLHRVRGIDIELAGLALAGLAGAGFVGNPVGGWLADRIGARRTLVAGLCVVAAGAGATGLVREASHAFLATGLLGLGAAVVWPSQDALLATLAGADSRAVAFSTRYATMNLGLGLGSVGGALMADVDSPMTFQLLFALQAAAFMTYAAIASLLLPNVAPPRATEHGTGPRGYRAVLDDRALRRLLPLVALLFAAGYAQYHAAFPAYAIGPGGLSASSLGIAFAVNTFTIVAAQLFVVRLVATRRRSRGLALVGVLWGIAWLVALTGGQFGGDARATLAFALAMAIFGIGETVLAPALGPLVNDLAPERLRGRYNGASALASTSGFVLGPALAGITLGAGLGSALLVGLAAACALASAVALRLEGSLPARINRPAPVLPAAPAGHVQ